MKLNGKSQIKTHIVNLLLLFITVCSFNCNYHKTDNDTTSQEDSVNRNKSQDIKFKYPSFTFVRVKYSSRGRGQGSWATDYPDSDLNFSARFQKVTGQKTDPKGKVLELTDPNLMQYPFIYIVEGGQILLSPEEVKGLRHYLLEGGFLMVDDFWGEDEWKNLYSQIKHVFPEREPVKLQLNHQIFNCFYHITEKPQVPCIAHGIASQTTGVTWCKEDGKEPFYLGLNDDNGRLMAVLCHNTDLGDGWEREGANEYYDREFSLKKAYPMGINIVIYALTH